VHGVGDELVVLGLLLGADVGLVAAVLLVAPDEVAPGSPSGCSSEGCRLAGSAFLLLSSCGVAAALLIPAMR
jgi:hypothetical protein